MKNPSATNQQQQQQQQKAAALTAGNPAEQHKKTYTHFKRQVCVAVVSPLSMSTTLANHQVAAACVAAPLSVLWDTPACLMAYEVHGAQ